MEKTPFSNFEIFTSYEEYLVFEVLKKCKENRDVKFECFFVDNNISYRPDIYAPDGIPSLGFEGPTMIEVKRKMSISSLQAIKFRFNQLCSKYNILVVYFESSLTNSPAEINQNGHNCKFMSYLNFKGLKKNADDKDKYYLRQAKEKNWKADREDIIVAAQKIVEQGNCVLFLGAGVSMSAKMPSWNKLLKSLMGEVKQLKGETLEAFKELSSHVLDECGDSYLVMARYLQTAIRLYDDKIDFSKLIQKHLYSEEHTSRLLKDLALIVQQKKAEEVLTYNFDDILEQGLTELGLENGHDFLTISKDAEIKGHNMLPIYHVHGVIPEQGPADVVVFSEEEYHKRYANPFHWSNIEQLHAMSRKHCFFIGLSMTDPNLRRLLDAAREINQTDHECHYAFLQRQKIDKYCLADMDKTCKYVHVSESLIDKKKQKSIYELNYAVIESIFRNLGVKVIWFEEFDDLPALVEKVFGLNSNVSVETSELLEKAGNYINEIEIIEKGLQEFNNSLTSENIQKILTYVNENGEKYRKLISETGDMLTELSNRVDTSDINILRKLQNNIPTYNNNIGGYGELYLPWFNFLKNILKSNESFYNN